MTGETDTVLEYVNKKPAPYPVPDYHGERRVIPPPRPEEVVDVRTAPTWERWFFNKAINRAVYQSMDPGMWPGTKPNRVVDLMVSNSHAIMPFACLFVLVVVSKLRFRRRV